MPPMISHHTSGTRRRRAGRPGSERPRPPPATGDGDHGEQDAEISAEPTSRPVGTEVTTLLRGLGGGRVQPVMRREQARPERHGAPVRSGRRAARRRRRTRPAGPGARPGRASGPGTGAPGRPPGCGRSGSCRESRRSSPVSMRSVTPSSFHRVTSQLTIAASGDDDRQHQVVPVRAVAAADRPGGGQPGQRQHREQRRGPSAPAATAGAAAASPRPRSPARGARSRCPAVPRRHRPAALASPRAASRSRSRAASSRSRPGIRASLAAAAVCSFTVARRKMRSMGPGADVDELHPAVGDHRQAADQHPALHDEVLVALRCTPRTGTGCGRTTAPPARRRSPRQRRSWPPPGRPLNRPPCPRRSRALRPPASTSARRIRHRRGEGHITPRSGKPGMATRYPVPGQPGCRRWPATAWLNA